MPSINLGAANSQQHSDLGIRDDDQKPRFSGEASTQYKSTGGGLPTSVLEIRSSRSSVEASVEEDLDFTIVGGSPRNKDKNELTVTFAPSPRSSECEERTRYSAFSYVNECFSSTLPSHSKKLSLLGQLPNVNIDVANNLINHSQEAQDAKSGIADLTIRGNLRVGAGSEENQKCKLLPCLFPDRREVSAFHRSPPARVALPKLTEPIESHMYERLSDIAAYTRREPDQDTLELCGRPFVVETWHPQSEDPAPPHRAKARLLCQTARAESRPWDQADVTLKLGDDASLAYARHELSHGDWHASSKKELLATWPADFSHAAEKRSCRRMIGRCLRPLSSEAQQLTPRSGAGSAERKMVVLASRLVHWMSKHQGHTDTMARLKRGLAHLKVQAQSDKRREEEAKKKRWTITLNKTVLRRAKPAQTLDSNGNPLMDRSSLHSLLCDVAGVGEGGLDLRAQLAQGGESIDKLFDSIIHLQTDLHNEFGLVKRDARKGMCFDVFHNVVGTMVPGGLPDSVSKELFDEFAGVPAEEESTVDMIGVGASISKAQLVFGKSADSEAYPTEKHRERNQPSVIEMQK